MSRKNDITNIKVKDAEIGVLRVGEIDYISLTDLAKYTNPEKPSDCKDNLEHDEKNRRYGL